MTLRLLLDVVLHSKRNDVTLLTQLALLLYVTSWAH